MRALTLAGCALLLASCAAGRHGPPHGGPPPGGPGFGRPAGPQVFVSPSGEPFRAEPGAAYPSAAWFARADADADGRLTLAEFRADAERAFALFDQNADGWIDGFEVTRYETQLFPEIVRSAAFMGGPMGGPPGGGRGGPPGGGRGGGPGGGRGGPGGHGGPGGPGGHGSGGGMGVRLQGAAPFGLLNEPHPIMIADADQSRRVSREEWAKATDRRFKRLDVDQDGALSAAELPRTPVQGPPPEAGRHGR